MRTYFRASSQYFRFMGKNSQENWGRLWRTYLWKLDIKYISKGVADAVQTNNEIRRVIDSYETHKEGETTILHAPGISDRVLDPALEKHLKLVTYNGTKLLLLRGENLESVSAAEDFICISPRPRRSR